MFQIQEMMKDLIATAKGVNQVSNSNQEKKRSNKQISKTQKGNRKLEKSCKFASLVSECLSKSCASRLQ